MRRGPITSARDPSLEEGVSPVSQSARNTLFLVQRLREMGLDLGPDSQRSSAQGELPLSTTPFETLEGSFRSERARFYTLGHNRLKFFQPSPFFHVPAVDVSRCKTVSQIESALRRSWALRLRQLRSAHEWLQGLGSRVQVAGKGTQLLLRLTGVEGPPARVQSRTSIHLPSSGPLAEVSLNAPGERSHRPSPHLEHSTDLEIELGEAMQHLARRCKVTRRYSTPQAPAPPVRQRLVRRVLIVDRDRKVLSAAESLLGSRGFELDTFQTPERALAAFRSRSYDLVLAAARMPRGDGLEFTALVRELPGVENLPIVLIDERFSELQKREAIAAGAVGYFRKPLSWAEIGARMSELLECTNLRRFERLAARIPVHPGAEEGTAVEITDQVARGGFGLVANRELAPDSIQRYRIMLPGTSTAVTVEGQVVYLDAVPGEAHPHAGIRVLRFLDDHEPDWIRFIEELVRQASGKDEPLET